MLLILTSPRPVYLRNDTLASNIFSGNVADRIVYLGSYPIVYTWYRRLSLAHAPHNYITFCHYDPQNLNITNVDVNDKWNIAMNLFYDKKG